MASTASTAAATSPRAIRGQVRRLRSARLDRRARDRRQQRPRVVDQLDQPAARADDHTGPNTGSRLMPTQQLGDGAADHLLDEHAGERHAGVALEHRRDGGVDRVGRRQPEGERARVGLVRQVGRAELDRHREADLGRRGAGRRRLDEPPVGHRRRRRDATSRFESYSSSSGASGSSAPRLDGTGAGSARRALHAAHAPSAPSASRSPCSGATPRAYRASRRSAGNDSGIVDATATGTPGAADARSSALDGELDLAREADLGRLVDHQQRRRRPRRRAPR